MIIKQKVKKVAKGYRLKPKTHFLIKEIQEMLQIDQDAVISRACRRMKRELIKKGKFEFKKKITR